MEHGVKRFASTNFSRGKKYRILGLSGRPNRTWSVTKTVIKKKHKVKWTAASNFFVSHEMSDRT